MKRRNKGYTLIELIVVITTIIILVAVGIARMGQVRSDAQTVNAADVLASAEKMEQLAGVNSLTISQTDTKLRLLELQSKLAAAGYAHFNLNADSIATKINYNSSTGHWETKE